VQTANVTVTIDGTPFRGWEHVSVNASVKEAARSFSLRCAAEQGAATNRILKLHAKVQIFESGKIIFNGFLERKQGHLDKASGSITISGRAKGADAIDCSAEHKTGRFEKKDPLEIAKELDAYGIGFSSDGTLDKIDEYQLQPGASIFREVQRLCRDQGFTLAGQADGSILITQAGANAQNQAGSLVEGINILDITASFGVDHRHAHVKVRGQKYDGHTEKDYRVDESADDSSVPRKRTLVIVHDGDTDSKRAKKRARSRKDKAAGDGTQASVTVVGWHDEAGNLWEPGKKVWVSSPFCELEQYLLIESMAYEQDGRQGSFCRINLVDPRAHGGKSGSSGKASKSGSDWSAGTTLPEVTVEG